MVFRPYWKGYLKLSFVTCPVALMPATSDSERVKFRTINRATGQPVQSRYVDAVTGTEVKDEDEVKGYPRGDDEHVLLEEDELDAVALESTRTINIERFVPADSIGWIWYEKPHYLFPADAVGQEAFAVILAAMVETKRVGIARLVLGGRERPVMLQPRGNGIVLWTLHFGDEVRDAADMTSVVDAAKPKQNLVKLIKTLIAARKSDWEPDMVRDPVQDNILEMIARKKKGRKRPAKAGKKEPPPASNVINIADALRKSIASEK